MDHLEFDVLGDYTGGAECDGGGKKRMKWLSSESEEC